jgi:predicted Zn finger-like uncharacterized protein
MDVRCDRCGTEYEFDDTLVSERGTSVKCTNCGHQFKVYRPRAAQASPEEWVVRRGDGREKTFASLRELQRAILSRQVERGDKLARAGGVSRVLGAIPELSPFFDEADRNPQPPAPVRSRVVTPAGLGAPPAVASLYSESIPDAQPSVAMPLSQALSNGRGQTRQGIGAPAPPAPPAPPSPSMAEILDRDPPTIPISARERARPSEENEPETRRRAPVDSEPDHLYTPTPRDVDVSGEFAEDGTVYSRGRRAGVGRWVVGVVMLGTIGVLGATVGKKYLLQLTAPKASASASAAGDARVETMLTEGERALADGDLEGAKEQLIKASALAENDKRVLVDLARLAEAHADIPWLRLRLVPESAKDVRALAKRELDDLSARAKKAADKVFQAAPDDLAAVRVKLDSLRLIDDRSIARSLAPKLSSSALQPETAYVLAALDLGEASPPWTTVIERLRLAATAETSPGRARAALVYALARSGDTSSAKSELERMASSAKPYPLLPELRAFVNGGATADANAADAGAGDGGAAKAGAVDVAALPSAAAGAMPQTGGGAVVGRPSSGSGDEEPSTGEFSESDLQKKLFGDGKRGSMSKTHEVEVPAPKPTNQPKKPEIDTSDLPGVTPP